MRHWLGRVANWIGAAVVLLGFFLIAREHPRTSAILFGVTLIGAALVSAWYDYDYWQRKFLRWRHGDVLNNAAAIITPHIDQLAAEMGKVLKSDGRWDYLWQPWIDVSRQFVDTTVIPALPADQQRIITHVAPILREEVRSDASGRIFARAQQLGLVR